eukprot:6836198-Prymnesium_polylepis.1
MVGGTPPFTGATAAEMLAQILAARPSVDGFEPRVADVLLGMLCPQPAARLVGAALRAHAWFEGVPWEHLLD